MKVLSIGNSFSTDAHKWLHKLAEINGINLETSNLFIGGCSLETHWKNFIENNPDYSFEINGDEGKKMISIPEALASEKWDVVTFQQASHFSGMEETYEPYLTSLADAVKQVLPQAKLYFHQTWAYETDSLHPGFADYNHSQHEMFERIVSASEQSTQKLSPPVLLFRNYVKPHPNLIMQTAEYLFAATGFISLSITADLPQQPCGLAL